MSSHGMSWARQQFTGNPTAKAVLLLLGELVNDEGETTRGRQYLSDILEIHVDTVGRALARLEDLQLIKRDRRQASDTRRLPDRITLLMEATFEVSNQDPSTESETEDDAESPRRNDTGTEGDGGSDKEHDAKSPNEPDAESGIKDKPLNSGNNSSGAVALFEAEPSTAIAVPETRPEAIIAKRAYDGSKGALKYMAILKLSQEAMAHNYHPRDIDAAIGALWKAGRAVTAQTLGQYLQGIIGPNGRTAVPKPSTTNQRVSSALDRAARYRAEEEANAKV